MNMQVGKWQPCPPSPEIPSTSLDSTSPASQAEVHEPEVLEMAAMILMSLNTAREVPDICRHLSAIKILNNPHDAFKKHWIYCIHRGFPFSS